MTKRESREGVIKISTKPCSKSHRDTQITTAQKGYVTYKLSPLFRFSKLCFNLSLLQSQIFEFIFKPLHLGRSIATTVQEL